MTATATRSVRTKPPSITRCRATSTTASGPGPCRNRSVLLASIGRSWYKSDGLPYSDLPSTFDTVTHAVGRRDGELGRHRRRRRAGRQLEPALAVHDELHLLPARRTFGGDHEFKVGGYVHARVVSTAHQEARSGHAAAPDQNYRLYYSSGVPIEVLLYNSPFMSENNVDYQSAYIRDAWRIGDRLTLNRGPALRALRRLPAGAVEAGRSCSRPRPDYPQHRPLRLARHRRLASVCRMR